MMIDVVDDGARLPINNLFTRVLKKPKLYLSVNIESGKEFHSLDDRIRILEVKRFVQIGAITAGSLPLWEIEKN